jgi:hypothetical protein
MSAIYHVKIKKEYAEAVLADLEKMDAVELSREEEDHIPEVVKEDVLRRQAEAEKDPSILVDADVVFNMLKVD